MARPRATERFEFVSTLERSTNRLWGSHVRVPKRIAEQVIYRNSRRVVCSLNNISEFQCAILRSGSAFVISVNKQLRDKLGLEYGMDVRVALRKDSSRYGLPFPEELRELFRQDPEGKALFHALTPGRQRTLLYIIGSAKKTEQRAKRSATVIKHLKVQPGKDQLQTTQPVTEGSATFFPRSDCLGTNTDSDS